MNIFGKIFLFLILILFLTQDCHIMYQPVPPTDLDVITEEKDSHNKREKWIEMMHKAAPGTNWRRIEQQNQFEKHTKDYNLVKRDTALHFLNGTWREVGSSNLAGRILVTDYDADANEILCASSGGNIWKTRLDTIRWEIINDHFSIQDITFLKKVSNNEEKRILIASKTANIQGFYYSDDMGENWEIASGLENLAAWGKIIRCVMQYDKTLFLLVLEWDYTSWEPIVSIYKSANLGQSFSRVTYFPQSVIPDENKIDIWTSDFDQTPLYIATKLEFLQLEGGELTKIGDLHTESDNIVLTGLVNREDTTFYLANSNHSHTDFYASLDGGKTWTYLSSINQTPFRRNSFKASREDKMKLYFGGINCYTSSDLGVTWDKVNNWEEYYEDMETRLHADIPSIDIFNEEKNIFFISTDGGLFISNDEMETVQNLSLKDHNISQYYTVYTSRVNTSYIHAGSQDQGYQKTHHIITDKPIAFQQVISGDYGHIVSSDYGASIWMVYPGFILYYDDIINSTNSFRQEFDFTGHLWMPPLMADPYDPEACYLGGGTYTSGSKMIHVKKEGERLTFNALPFIFTNDSDAAISAMAFSKLNPDYWYVLNTNGAFFYSIDGGETWNQTLDYTAPEHQYFYGATILPSKAVLGRVYVGGSGYSNAPVFVSNDNGLTFEPMDENLPSTLVYKLDSDENDDYIIAATEAGPYIYDNQEKQWHNIDLEQAPDQTYWDVDYIENIQIARFATYGRGIWDYMVNPENTIEEISLAKNNSTIYPNPSDGQFHIAFSENTSWPKKITVFNTMGQIMFQKEISYLYPERFQISLKSQPGMYFVKIIQPEGKELHKVIIR